MEFTSTEKQPWLNIVNVSNRLWNSLARPTWPMLLLVLLALLALACKLQSTAPPLQPPPLVLVDAAAAADVAQQQRSRRRRSCSGFYSDGFEKMGKMVSMSIEEFGGVGDGKTSNTEAFRKAVARAKHGGCGGRRGGFELRVPKGRWVTGSFNLTSNFTLFLERGAVILGSQDPKDWPVIEALPSYGRGRERLGGRHISLLHGSGLTNVVITGQNGSIDGQGRMWWELWWNRTLKHTRGHLLELVNSTNILISNVTFLNSPFWTLHPVYCSNVVIKDVTVLAPLHSPNTDGIDPDSSTNVCIEDCYIESGDDLVAIKSGWDQYGISTARPSSNIIVQRISGTTPTCSGVGIGSEMSGGISNVFIDDLQIFNSAAAVRIKTDRGRGGYIANITITNIRVETVKIPIRFSRGADDHPDDGWDRKAFPRIHGIYISNVVGENVGRAPVLEGIEGTVFEGVSFRNVSLHGIKSHGDWQCEFVEGEACHVFPEPCPQLRSNGSSSWCMNS